MYITEESGAYLQGIELTSQLKRRTDLLLEGIESFGAAAELLCRESLPRRWILKEMVRAKGRGHWWRSETGRRGRTSGHRRPAAATTTRNVPRRSSLRSPPARRPAGNPPWTGEDDRSLRGQAMGVHSSSQIKRRRGRRIFFWPVWRPTLGIPKSHRGSARLGSARIFDPGDGVWDHLDPLG